MEAISHPLDNFNLDNNSLQLASVNRISAVIQDSIASASVFVLKTDQKHLWDYCYVNAARRFWDQRYALAIRNRINPLY